MNVFGDYQLNFTIKTAHFCEVALIGYGSDVVSGGIIHLYCDNILALAHEVCDIKSESGVAALVPADKFAVHKHLCNGIRRPELDKHTLVGAVAYKSSTVARKTSVIILATLTNACPAACAVLVIPCMRERYPLPIFVPEIRLMYRQAR